MVFKNYMCSLTPALASGKNSSARCLEQSFSAPVRFAPKSLRKTVSGALAPVFTT